MEQKQNQFNRKTPERKRNPAPLGSWIVYLLIAVMLTMGVSFSSYSTSASGSDSAQVAAFVFDIIEEEETQIADLEKIQAPGDEEKITFKVTSAGTEVAQTYWIKFEALGSLPLTYTLNEETSEANTTKLEKDLGSGTVQAGVDLNKVYHLKVIWPEGETDPKYSSGSGIASVRITAGAEQVD